MTEVNVPLLRKAVEWVEEQATRPPRESEWAQNDWVSGPAKRAHRLVLDAYYESGMLIDSYGVDRAIAQMEPHCGTAFCVAGWVAQELDERYLQSENVDGVHVSQFAAEALGIPYGTLEHTNEVKVELFGGTNTAEDIRMIAENLAGEKL